MEMPRPSRRAFVLGDHSIHSCEHTDEALAMVVRSGRCDNICGCGREMARGDYCFVTMAGIVASEEKNESRR